MVSNTTNTAVTVALLLTVVLPLLLIVFYIAKNKGKKTGSAVVLGMIEFLVVQLMISSPVSAMASAKFSILGTGMIALVIGGFETVATYFLARYLEKDLTFERSVAAGMGHGTIESIFRVGIACILNTFYIQMMNNGEFDRIIQGAKEAGEDIESLMALKENLVSAGMWTHYHAAAQQTLMFLFHMGMTVFFCYLFHGKKKKTAMAFCFGMQFAVTFVVQALDAIAGRTSYIMMYVFLAATALLSLFVMAVVYRRWKEQEDKEQKKKLWKSQWKERNRQNRVKQKGEAVDEQTGNHN